MASLADELLADVGPADAGAVEEPRADNDAPAGAGTVDSDVPAADGSLADGGDDGGAADELAHGASQPPEEMDQEAVDAMDLGKESVDSASHVVRLLHSNDVKELLTVRVAVIGCATHTAVD